MLTQVSAQSPLSTDAIQLPNAYIPVTHKNHILVLCFDGSGDQFNSDNLNIVKLFSMLKKDNPTKQMVYYQVVIDSTYTTPQITTPMVAKMSKTLDEMIAWNLDTHIMGGHALPTTQILQKIDFHSIGLVFWMTLCGGSVTNETKPNLAHIPLCWMICKCFKTDSRIIFSINDLQTVGLNPIALLKNPSQQPPPLLVRPYCIQAIPKKPVDTEVQASNNLAKAGLTEEEFELWDTMFPVYDQFSICWAWWILELIPLYHQFQCSNNT
ncbi:hypothetical protein BDQ12DRAFT_727644 [Crucibulum laeve]|uniref:T6SS Phospholipase effector Tle1-like catalytic domain-containing protein n=1 Tax=Crucibulum laeve TaxID=68775 RepID=A0A5C3LXX6_9AGAR|nr:hypothetical protein BDQ12DRAFT_727644 [Crucibulum laeve]